MAIFVGSGPFGQAPGGVFNRETPDKKGLIYFEDFPRRMRADLGGETVVDTTRAKLLHEHGHLPVLYVPEDDVRTDLLEQTDKHTTCPWKGEASYWTLRVGDREAENAVWGYPDPIEEAPPLAGYLAFDWSAMDRWLEEDEEALAHVRDPYHRVDVLETSRHVKVTLDGEVLAESDRPKAIYETGLPVRWYIPPEDVRTDALRPSDKQTVCPYKGVASYRSVQVNGSVREDLVWTYPDPLHDAARVRNHLSFMPGQVEIEVDGEKA